MDQVDTIGVQGRCTKRSARNAKKSVKSLLSLAATVPFSAKSATQRKKIAADKQRKNVTKWEER